MQLKFCIFCLMFTINAVVPATCMAEVFYADPIHGNMKNNGSNKNPWSTVQEVFEQGLLGTKVQQGDTILLRSGHHGQIVYSNAHNSDYITIAAEQGHTPKLKKIWLSSCSKWIFRGLTVSPEFAPEGYKSLGVSGIIRLTASEDIIIDKNNIFSVQDASNWTKDDWIKKSSRGVFMWGNQNNIVRNNTIKNVEIGILVSDNTLVEHNQIEYIAHDGIVGLGNDITLQYNTIKNFIAVLGHPDAIQFHRGTDKSTPINNVTIRGNLVISHDPNPDNPLLKSPQGINNFDTPSKNWRVENNVVLVQHYHGISIFHSENSVIINNITFDPTGKWPTWIHLGPGGKNTIVRNNMSREFYLKGQNITQDHNLDIDRYNLNSLFVNYKNNDVRHKAGSPAIDSGSSLKAPSVDRDKNSRPQGSGFDIGAYEYVPSNSDNQAPALRKIGNKSVVENSPFASYSW